MAERFESKDMAGAVFHGVNLGGADFDDVNLGGATFHNINMGDVKIDNVNINGLTINGVRVDRLVEEELDRRDPERVRLRIKDPHDVSEVLRVMANLAEARDGFAATLRASAPEALLERTAEGKWSAMEHLRHLVFAEDLYLNRWILRNDEPWSKVGLLPHFLANDEKFADVGSDACEDLETVLAEWERIFSGFKTFVDGVTREALEVETKDIDYGQGTVGGVLAGLAGHDLAHIRTAEATLAKAGGEGPCCGGD